MQESLRLPKGRGRGLNRGGGHLSQCQSRVPAIPPFPFQHQPSFGTGKAPTTALKPLTMGRGMCNIETPGPYDPVLPGQCFSVPLGSRGRDPVPRNVNGLDPRASNGPTSLHSFYGPSPQGFIGRAPYDSVGPSPRGISGPPPRGISGPPPGGISDPSKHGSWSPSPQGFKVPAPRLGFSGPAPRGNSGPSPLSFKVPSPEDFSLPPPRSNGGPSRSKVSSPEDLRVPRPGDNSGPSPLSFKVPSPEDLSVPSPRVSRGGPANQSPRGPFLQGFGGPAPKKVSGPSPKVFSGPSPQRFSRSSSSGFHGSAPQSSSSTPQVCFLALADPVPRGRGIGVGDCVPRFHESERAVMNPNLSHGIPSLPEPRPNSLTQVEWDVFIRNGRPSHKNVCAVFCCCTFGEGNSVQRTFSFCCDAKSRWEHAEKKAIEQLLMLENGSGRELRHVVFISSRSPCIPCAKDMITFVKSRGLSMNLYFTALQKVINPVKSGVQLLADFGMPMQIADKHIWSYLTSLLAVSNGKPRTALSDGREVNVTCRKAWDVTWSHQLTAVLHRDHNNVLDSKSLLAKFEDVRVAMMAKGQANS
ncbi:nascent polypeptide-associated complex subunit alpha, muscle-specific form-like [Ischnura elegans]|uniref:nascent polypeptide-associated complex subunit alpha, muscle-specific form-like n=1 Tax=Ischnura elegans TaxID=197161 RepID=UPI001ED8B624|nr:nascent polypeptide-associated complex subunit alpha, muscle-specific form-like [Ischnura elegans]